MGLATNHRQPSELKRCWLASDGWADGWVDGWGDGVKSIDKLMIAAGWMVNQLIYEGLKLRWIVVSNGLVMNHDD